MKKRRYTKKDKLTITEAEVFDKAEEHRAFIAAEIADRISRNNPLLQKVLRQRKATKQPG